MNEQQQMIDQQGINTENNMNSVAQNNQPNPTPTNQNEISPMNKVDQNNQTNPMPKNQNEISPMNPKVN